MIGLVDCVGILKLRNADVENKWKSNSQQLQPKPKESLFATVFDLINDFSLSNSYKVILCFPL